MSGNKATIAKIGKHIAELRKEKGYTQRTLSEMVYVGEKTVSKWERGIVAPDIAMIKTLSNIFEVSVDELLSGEKVENSIENGTVAAINAYTYQAKHKVLKVSLFIGFFFLITFLLIFFISRYYMWKVERFEIQDQLSVYGYTISNNLDTKVIVDKIIYDDPYAGTSDELKANYIKMSLYSADEEICSSEFSYDNDIAVFSIMNNYIFICDNEKKFNDKELSLRFDFVGKNSSMKKEISLKK
jgi:transcriptional regulator with XRE-family HTH domain